MPDAAVVWSPASPQGKKGQLGLNSFSTPPTIAEINASSDWYQVFALYNRRAAQIYNAPAPQTLGNSGAGHWPTAASVNALRTAINTMRMDMGLNAYPFGATLSAGSIIRAQHLIDLRAAISAVPAVLNITAASSYGHKRTDNPYGTIISEADFGLNFAGQSAPYSGNVDRYRTGGSVLIPSFSSPLNTSAVAQVKIGCQHFFAPIDLYLSSSDDHGKPSGWWNHADTFYGNIIFAMFAISAFVPMPFSTLQAAAGRYLSFLVANPTEFRNINNFSGNDAAQDISIILIKIDFGF